MRRRTWTDGLFIRALRRSYGLVALIRGQGLFQRVDAGQEHKHVVFLKPEAGGWSGAVSIRLL